MNKYGDTKAHIKEGAHKKAAAYECSRSGI
jgi:hypothetical protein